MPLSVPFQLVLFLGGRRHPASVVRMPDGRTTVRLEEPYDSSARADAAAKHLRETGISYSVDSLEAPVPNEGSLHRGTVSRLNSDADFGYVDDDDGVHCYIFVFGHAIKHSDAMRLSIGARVRFRLEGTGRVMDLRRD